jgi:peptidoglycan-N-acetylglucosamine deacetylase
MRGRLRVIVALAAFTLASAAVPAYAFTPVRSAPVPAPLGHGHRTIALTFDDGPDRTWTPQILRLLAAHHVLATFCEIGYAVDAHAGLTRRVARAGQRLCDHTQDHDEHLRDTSAHHIHWDIHTAKRAITRADSGVRPLFFRAPGGNWSSTIKKEARTEHLQPLGWNVDPQDWARPGTQAIVHRVLAQVRPGSVILLHDGGGDRSQTVAALRILLRKLPQRGYRFTVPPATGPGIDV